MDVLPGPDQRRVSIDARVKPAHDEAKSALTVHNKKASPRDGREAFLFVGKRSKRTRLIAYV
jgi:hypothetical protein